MVKRCSVIFVVPPNGGYYSGQVRTRVARIDTVWSHAQHALDVLERHRISLARNFGMLLSLDVIGRSCLVQLIDIALCFHFNTVSARAVKNSILLFNYPYPCANTTQQRIYRHRFLILRIIDSMRQTLATTLLGLATLAAALYQGPLRARDFDPDNLADDLTWGQFECKGNQLVRAMMGSDAEAGQLWGKASAQSEFRADMKR
jgi:hypothetical protein